MPSWFPVLLIIVSVWASTLAGFALSVAAVAGALLIVSKDLVMCVPGYLYVTLAQPFKVGDLIAFNQLHGRVADIDLFATTLVELGHAGPVTGTTAEFPNGLLLTIPLKNNSRTGEHALHLIRMPIPGGRGADPDRRGCPGGGRSGHQRLARRGRGPLPQDFRRELHRLPFGPKPGFLGLLRPEAARLRRARHVPRRGTCQG